MGSETKRSLPDARHGAVRREVLPLPRRWSSRSAVRAVAANHRTRFAGERSSRGVLHWRLFVLLCRVDARSRRLWESGRTRAAGVLIAHARRGSVCPLSLQSSRCLRSRDRGRLLFGRRGHLLPFARLDGKPTCLISRGRRIDVRTCARLPAALGVRWLYLLRCTCDLHSAEARRAYSLERRCLVSRRVHCFRTDGRCVQLCSIRRSLRVWAPLPSRR